MYDEKLELLIAGEWCQGSEGKTEALLNPATEEVLAQVPHASASDLDMVSKCGVQRRQRPASR